MPEAIPAATGEDLILSLLRPHLLSLKPYSSARSEFDGRAEVYLDANENPFEGGYNRYPDPLQRDLKTALSGIHGVDVESIFVGNGSDEAIDLLMRLIGRPGRDCILQMPPTYGMYKVSAAINNLALVDVPLGADFQPDVRQVLAKASELGEQAKLLFVCTPNNPTGNDFKRDHVLSLIEGFDGLVVVDQAYSDFSSAPSYVDLLSDHPNLVVLQTLSKAYGLASARLGVAFASTAIVRWLNAIKPPYNVSGPSQAAGLEVLRDEARTRLQIKDILTERTRLEAELNSFEGIEQVYPSDSNFVLCRVPRADTWYAALVGQGIVVRNQTSKFEGVGHLRFTVGTAEENVRLLEALRALS